MNQEQNIIFNLSFFNKVTPEKIAVNYQNKSISYGKLCAEISDASVELNKVNGHEVIIDFKDPIKHIIYFLAAIEAGGKVLVGKTKYLFEEDSVLEKLSAKNTFLYTDNSKLTSLENKGFITQLKANTLENNKNNNNTKGGVILFNNDEAYNVSLETIKTHIEETTIAFKLREPKTIFAYKEDIKEDVLELLLPVISNNSTLNIIDNTITEFSIDKTKDILKINKERLKEEVSVLKSSQYDFSTIIVSSDSRITKSMVFQLQETFIVNELIVTYQLENIMLSVIQANITEKIVKNEIQSIGYTKPFGKCNVHILDEKRRTPAIKVPGTLWFESKLISNSIGTNKALEIVTIKNTSRTLRALNHKASFEFGKKIALLNNIKREINVNNTLITPDVTEEILNNHSEVAKAAVIYKKNDDQLIAFVTLKKEQEINSSILRNWLKKHTESKNIPSHISILPELPKNSFNDIDYHALDQKQLNFSKKTPLTSTQQELLVIWEKLLEVRNIDLEDNFFELGGHSLLATRLASMIRKEMGKEIPITTIFLYPTIEMLAEELSSNSQKTSIPNIVSLDKKGDIPLSFSQQRVWFMDQLQGTRDYHISGGIKLKGAINPLIVETSLRTILERHEALRTIITSKDGIGYQKVIPTKDWNLSIEENTINASEQELIANYAEQPFDLTKDYMFRAGFYTLNKNEYLLTCVFHHIASDGWSIQVFIKEFIKAYEALQTNEKPTLATLPISYADYAIWQQENSKGSFLNEQISYWKEKLKNVTPVSLITDADRPKKSSSKATSLELIFKPELEKELQQLSSNYGSTLFMTLIATFKILLFKYTAQEDICVGTPISGRTHQELEDLIGYFVNTLVIRNEVTNDLPFETFLQQVKKTSLEAYKHQDVPFEKVVEATTKERNLERNPFHQVMFSFENTNLTQELVIADAKVELIKPNKVRIQGDINFIIEEDSERGLVLDIQYKEELFSKTSIKKLAEHYQQLLTSIVKNPFQKIGALEMLSEHETTELIETFNQTELSYSKEHSIIDVFAAIVAKTPNKIALVFENDTMSYEKLDEESNKVAAYLQAINTKKESHIGILFNRGFDMLISILGILKAGCTYVPLDPTLPLHRLSFIIEDSSIDKIIYGEDHLLTSLPIEKEVFISIHEMVSSTFTLTKVNRNLDSVTYIMYTSGTTGTPKGIQITDENVLTLIYHNDSLQIKATDEVLQWSNYAFDGCVYEIFGSLLSGATLHLIKNTTAANIIDLSEVIEKKQLSIVFLTTALFNSFVDYNISALKNVRVLLFGGEKVSINHVQKAFDFLGSGVLIHVYGPTETTTYATYYPIHHIPEKSNTIPIGKPLSNTQTYVLNTTQQLVPIGITGELYIGGTGVSKGYVNREVLTAKMFVQSPFKKGEILYRTGDLVRWSEDKNIEFIGRTDSQVKIRGYRIELAEIESVLFDYHAISNACILVKEDTKGNKRLVAYVVSETNFSKEGIENFLKEKLPSYMIPNIWVTLDTIPLTSNGKINKKALPAPDMGHISNAIYIAPSNEKETKLATIWSQLLGIEKIGVQDNFFELGGHSLLVTQVVSKIRKEMNIEVPVKTIFLFPTIAQLSKEMISIAKAPLLPTIHSQEKPAFIPLSYGQQGMWFLDKLQGSREYHISGGLQLEGNIDFDILETSLKAVINRHEILRTVIKEENGVGYQEVLSENKWQLSKNTIAKGINEKEAITKFLNIPFNLSKDYMFRACLFTIEGGKNILACVFHHIASDGWSLPIFIKEFAHTYKAFQAKQKTNLPKLPFQYSDFAIWQRNNIQGEFLENQLSYWEKKLENVIPLSLPTDFVRPSVQSTKGAHIYFDIDNSLKNDLYNICKEEKVTLFMMLLGAFKVLLNKYSGQNDICIGTPIANRNQTDLEDMIGYFVNTLPLRSNVDQNLNFQDFLQQIKETTLESYQYQHAPFDKVTERIVGDRDISITQIFQVMFDLRNISKLEELTINDLKLSPYEFEENTAQFDLNFSAEEHKNGISFDMEFCTDLFERSTVQRMLNHYEQILKSITTDYKQSIASLSILTPQEKEQLLYRFNNTKVEYPLHLSIVDLFKKQVTKTPNNIALSFEGQEITYEALDKKSTQIANYLITQGIKEDDFVGICLERSFTMVVGILAILKSGAAYVPIKPDYPESRVNHILEDINCDILLTDKASKNTLDKLNLKNSKIVVLDSKNSDFANYSTTVEKVYNPNSLAYVIYTSGSTGKPKGALIEHKGLLNHLLLMIDELQLNSKSTIAFTAPFTFDISVWQILTSLLVGGKTAIYKEQDLLETNTFIDSLSKEKVTILQLVPSYTSSLLETVSSKKLEQLNYFLVTGEAVTKDVLDRWFNAYPNVPVVNAYGPAEASDDVSLHIMTKSPKEGLVSIGKPVANTQIYIADSHQNLCPIGVIGELYIGGTGVGRGYLNLEELTQEKFIVNPYTGKGKVYRTGDLGRWLTDGIIEFVGRSDDQVKIRGHRIELGEIENELSTIPGITSCCVLAVEDEKENKNLVGYVVTDVKLDTHTIQDLLKDKLPEYMVPKLWLLLDEMPLTANGKIDKKTLPNLDNSNLSSKEFLAPQSETEVSLAIIWQDLLAVENIGIEDNFFDLGGHSLKVVSLISQIQKKLATEISIKDVFTKPTIKSLATIIDKNKKIDFEVIPTIKKAPYYPVSNAQKRLWVLDRFVDDVSGYNAYDTYIIKGKINIEAFGSSVLNVVNRHEVLRTTFSEKKGEPVQIIHSNINKKQVFEIIDYTSLNKTREDLVSELTTIANTPFDLEKPLLFTSKFYILNEDEYLFFCSMHHIICDGWSNNILLKEIFTSYKAFENSKEVVLPELKIQYKDYAAWQLHQLSSGNYENHKQYWHKKLGGNIPILNFPSYNSRPMVQEFSGAAIEYVFSNSLLTKVKELAKKQEASLFMSLVSFLNILMYKYTSQTDIVLGTGTAGRTHPDLENQLGYYVTTLVLRNEIDPESSFTKLLNNIKENTIEAFEHQDYPFDVLANELDLERDISRNPIFDIMILLQSLDESEDKLFTEGLKDAQIEHIPIENKGTPFDMDFDFIELKDGLKLTLTYNNIIYTNTQMHNVIKHFENLIECVLENPDNKIGAISLITEEEIALVKEINQTEKELPLEKTYHHFLEKFAVETPEKEAIIFEDKKITYSILNKDVNKLARVIDKKVHLKEDDQVAILSKRSDLVMKSILAVWKLGAAYIPVDKKVPDNRVLSMLEIGKVTAIIADKNLISEELKLAIPKICKLLYIQDLLEESNHEEDTNLNIKINPNSLSVTMFTSGSTGLPKGAMNEHIGMMNHALATVDYLNMDTNAVLIQNASLSFDIAVWQLFTALITGGTTLICGDSLVNSPEKLLEDLVKYKATVFQVVPSYLSMLLDIISGNENQYPLEITHLICCGEAVKPSSIENWLSKYPFTTIVNDYGPAEASDGTTWNVFDSLEKNTTSIPIGKPIYNMSNYIVDDYMNLSPIGTVGEICVAGTGVGRGYINEPEKTKNAFFQDPFNTTKKQRLYKTGDLGKLLPNGMIEFHGRKDYQVKVNGQRIELGEIEVQLLQLNGVKDTAVIDRINAKNGRKYLHAFIVFEDNASKDHQEVKSNLSNQLPSYMVPSEYQKIDTIPLTMSGKVDRKYLLSIAEDITEKLDLTIIASENEIEAILVEAWKATLKLAQVSTTDNFYEIGGDSISAIQVSSFLYKNQYQVDVRDIMRYVTIKEVANYVKPLQRIAEQGIITGEFSLTPIQKAFFTLNKKEPNYYNQSVILSSNERVNVTILKKALAAIQRWHDALRVSYTFNEENIVQTIQNDDLEVTVKTYDLPNATKIEDFKNEAIQVQSSISLEKGPLMQTGVFKTKEIDYILITVHHLVIDAVSWRILLEDFSSIYEQIELDDEIELPAKTDSFKHWSKELENFIQSSNFEEEKTFWNNRILEKTTTKIPYDSSANEIGIVKKYINKTIQLEKEYVSLLETKVHKAFNTDINDILLVALSESVYKIFGIPETSIMLESHGRTQLNETVNTTRTLGWFTSEYPVYLPSTSKGELKDVIKEVKEHLHKVPNNGIGFGLLRYKDEHIASQHIKNISLPQIAFNYLGSIDEVANNTRFKVLDDNLDIDESPNNQSDYPVEFLGYMKDGVLEFTLGYHKNNFNDSTIEKWLTNFKTSLIRVIDYCANQEYTEATPSDYDYSDLSLDDLVELNDIF